MSEQPLPTKSPISNLPRGALIKGLPINRNTRLPSIRTPRDLTLGAQPKRVFTPKIPIRREKKNSVPNAETPPLTNVENKVEKKSPSPAFSKGKRFVKNIIQTEGTLFGEGVAAGTSRIDKQRESVPRYTARKAVKKEFDMADVKSSINDLLRDDFIDDDDDEDDEDELKPVIYPSTNNIEKTIKKEIAKIEPNEDQVFEDGFAKEMGYDVNKIAQFIKKEKCSDEVKVIPKIEFPHNSQSELLDLFKSDERMFLLQFPKDFNIVQPEDVRDLNSHLSNSNEQINTKNKDKFGLPALPEGCIGKFQVLKSGRVRLVVGDNSFDINMGTTLRNKHEVLSVQLDSTSNDMAVLGNIEHKLLITPNVDKISEPIR